MDTSQTIRHLHEEMEKELQELRELQVKLQEAQMDATKRGQEIPKLQAQVEADRHEIYVDTKNVDDYRKKIAHIQSEKVRHQNELNQMQNALRKTATEHSKLTR